jgi:sugar lactone lactonase YvrE
MHGKVFILLVLIAFLSGCSLSSTPTKLTGTESPGTTAFTGIVHGGQQPVSGSTVQLWQVGTTGYGSGAATLGSSVLSAGDGTFGITGDYTCPSASTLVYITATGGNPGPGSNTAISLMTPLGACGNLTSSTFIAINEVTTVAAVYALSQFMNSSGVIGSYGYSNQGLVNAFAAVPNLVDTSFGTARATTPNGNGIVPQAEINTLANILASCINSAGSSSAACTNLFNAATPATNTLTAALAIAQNPARNVTTLFGLTSASPAFQPTLSSAPNDWTLALSYAAGGTNAQSIAIDASGSVWIANHGDGTSDGSAGVSKLSPIGVPASGSPFTLNLPNPYAIAIDQSGNAWVANFTSNTVMEVASNGNTLAGPISFSETSNPEGIAVDGSNNVWIANTGTNSVTEISSTINQIHNLSPSGGFTGGGLNTPEGIAIDQSGNLWITNAPGGTSTISKVAYGGTVSGPYSGTGLGSPFGIAIGLSSDVWVTNTNQTSIAEFDTTGTELGLGITGGGITQSYGVAVDGAGTAWVANTAGQSLSAVNASRTAISPSTGYQGGNLHYPYSIAVDGSGNVWLANGSALTVNGSLQTVTEFVGVAVPAVTPLSVAAGQSQIGVRPGTPIPVAITSATLPFYAPTIAYTAQLYATGGNSSTFTWSKTAGSLPTGLSLSSSGLISGTPSATGSSTFTAQACDSLNLTNCASQSFTVGSTSTLPTGTNNAALNGTYAVRFSGFRNPVSTQGAVTGDMFIGSLTFDGNGNMTNAEVDVMNPNSSSDQLSSGLTGTYEVGSDNRGLILITPPGQHPLELAIAVSNFTGAVGHTFNFIELDDTIAANGGSGGELGAGIGKFATTTAFASSTLNATFVFGFEGESPCTNYNSTNPSCPQTVTPFGPVTAAGYFTANGSGSITAGEQDAQAVGNNYNAISLAGSTYTNPDATYGRGTITLAYTGTTYPVAPTHFAYYVVNSGELFVLSTDGHLNNTMLSGDVLVQPSGVFSGSAPNPLSGTYIGYDISGTNGDGVSYFPTQSDAQLLMITASGTNLTPLADENNAGQIKLNENFGTIPYTVDAHGRLNLGSGEPIFYFASLTQGFGTTQAQSSTDNPGLLTLQKQTVATYSNASINGTYAFGPIAPSVFTSNNSGIFVSTGTGTATTTSDNSQNTGVISQGSTGTYTLTTAANGRTTAIDSSNSTNVLYLISPTNAVFLNANPSNKAPTITVSQK